MNVAMWVRALRVIPRITKDDWNALDVISRWLISTRAAVLIMTFISGAIAGIFAARDGRFDLGAWLLLEVGLVMAHATNNLLNDYTDYVRGVDKDNYYRAQYGPQPLEHGLMTKRELLTYAVVTGLIACAAGGLLVGLRGWLALGLMLVGAFFVLFYTWPLKYIGLGELTVLLVWGPLMIGGGYFVITGEWSWMVVLASLPYALGPTTVIFGKHIDKYEADTAKGIHTLPVIIGEHPARLMVSALMILQYLLLVYLIVIGYFTPVVLIVVFALGLLRQALAQFRRPKPDAPPDWYPTDAWPLWFVSLAFIHNRRFGLLLIVGLILDVVVRGVLVH
jgi:1,4-dihydroxy-2-naphthoate octaprenyltransferase